MYNCKIPVCMYYIVPKGFDTMTKIRIRHNNQLLITIHKTTHLL